MKLNELLGYLDPLTQGSIINLMEDVPRRALDHDAQQALDWRRAMTIGTLHRRFEQRRRDRADIRIEEVWTERSAFGLLLRNFDLGARSARSGKWNVTRMNMHDLRLQHLLCDPKIPIPFFKISNPAFDQGPDRLYSLELDEIEWPTVASALVSTAALIVMLYSKPTPGVSVELDFIRRCGREASTVLVAPPEVAASDLGQFQEHGFVVVANWSSDQHDRRVIDPVADMARSPRTTHFPPMPAFRAGRQLPERLAKTASRVAVEACRTADQMTDERRAESEYIRALGLAFFADDDEERGVIYTKLRDIARYRGNEALAEEFQGWAEETLGRIGCESFLNTG